MEELAADSSPPTVRDTGKHYKHCKPPVGSGAKPQPKSISVNFRTKLNLWCNLNLP